MRTKEQPNMPEQAQRKTESVEAKKRGGARPGAGRKPKGVVVASRVLRVPEQYEAAVRALVAHLDASAQLGRNYGPFLSEPLFIRSLHGKAQSLTFTVAPLK